jgi:hypothetical protein
MAMAVVLPLLGAGTDVASAQAVAGGGERFFLSGVVVVEGGDSKAWIQEPTLTQDKIRVMRVGDKVGRWTLAAISPNRVEFKSPEGSFFVPLNGVGGPGSSSRAAAAPASPTPAPAASAPGSGGDGGVNIAVGDPRRRESIRQLFGGLSQGASPFSQRPAGSPTGSIVESAPRKADGPVPGMAAESAAPSRPPGKVVLPVGDPRRREAIRQLFGTR